MSDELRIYLIWRAELVMPLGKALGQAGHAFTNILENVRISDPTLHHTYVSSSTHAKITLNGKTLSKMERLQSELDEAKIPYYVVTDLGHTVFPEPTITCMAVGPMMRDAMPPFMKKLQLL